ncbi:BSD domain containing protein [Rhynchospora pubera]|uniref:BSD domain containing protein n=1 Tax=Rhynchospora pubera TaxID=906938 RepID=A0AAV8HN48_9POAL|nr:BSD domain containing protein [Rhynchospora pubera]
MDLWQRARSFAEEAAKKSQEFSKEAAKRSQELTQGASRLLSSEFAAEATKKSRELAAEATKKSKELAVEATKKADLLAGQIKTLASDIPVPAIPAIPAIPAQLSAVVTGSTAAVAPEPETDLEVFGVTEDLREFVRGLTMNTFRDFPLQDEPEMAEVPTVSNVRQDLNEWQAKHAIIVLSAVKEISKFRYELCPRYMKERKFWRIYFLLVNTYVSPYERKYMDDLKAKEEQKKEEKLKEVAMSPQGAGETKLESKGSVSSSKELDLDTFLLGDFEDEAPDEAAGDDGLDDDFDKIDSASGLGSDDEKKATD